MEDERLKKFGNVINKFVHGKSNPTGIYKDKNSYGPFINLLCYKDHDRGSEELVGVLNSEWL